MVLFQQAQKAKEAAQHCAASLIKPKFIKMPMPRTMKAKSDPAPKEIVKLLHAHEEEHKKKVVAKGLTKEELCLICKCPEKHLCKDTRDRSSRFKLH